MSDVHAATFGLEGPSDILPGTPMTFSATFDPSKEVARPTIYNIDAVTGLPLALDIRTVTF